MTGYITVRLSAPDDVAGWISAASGLLAAGVRPELVVFSYGGVPDDLFARAPGPPASPQGVAPLPDWVGCKKWHHPRHMDNPFP